MRDSVGSCPHQGSWPVVLLFGCVWHNKSALIEHATQENHVVNWSQATVIDRQPERFTRWIKEAIHIRKEGQQAMNRDEGSYQLSHAYDRFLHTASSRRVKNRKN